MTTLNCENKCCNYIITDYKHPSNFDKNNCNWREQNVEKKIKKAGAFVYDKKQNKILLVQSRGQYWGPPKGSMDKEETIKECAVREVKEETGIDISPDSLERFYIVKGKALYYYYELEENEIYVQNHIKDNDANGIGWFSVECLPYLIKEKKITINQHCKILIKRYLDFDIDYELKKI